MITLVFIYFIKDLFVKLSIYQIRSYYSDGFNTLHR